MDNIIRRTNVMRECPFIMKKTQTVHDILFSALPILIFFEGNKNTTRAFTHAR